MGFFDSWSDLVAAATPWSSVEAEAAEPVPADAESKVRLSSQHLAIAILLGGMVGIGRRREIVLWSQSIKGDVQRSVKCTNLEWLPRLVFGVTDARAEEIVLNNQVYWLEKIL